MVDLQGQYAKIKPQVNKAFESVLDTAYYIGGPEVKGFGSDLEKYLDDEAKRITKDLVSEDMLKLIESSYKKIDNSKKFNMTPKPEKLELLYNKMYSYRKHLLLLYHR